MPRIEVPGTDHWFDLEPVEFLTVDHQDSYLELIDELREKVRAALPPAPPPANPAVAEPEPVVRLGRAEIRQLQDLLLSWIFTGSSYALQVPWTPENRRQIPLSHWNVLRDALEPFYGPINGEGPKAPETGDGSATTSGESTPNPLQAPPAASSATPAGS
jgi:hypothetical protein